MLASVSEFPERLGPVLIKELRQGLRSGLFVLPFLILPIVLAVTVVWALSVDNLGRARSTVGGFFWLAVIMPVVVLTPLRALGAIRTEREAQTLELLQLTPLTAWRIVWAKWSSLMAQALLWVVALLPFFVLRYFFGGINLTEEFLVLFWVVLAGGALTAVAMVISSLPRLVFWLAIAALLFFSLWGVGMTLGMMFSGGAAFIRLGRAPWLVQLTMTVVYAHFILLTLTFAASRIAPPADNYAARLRLGGLGLFAWWGLAYALFPAPVRQGHWVLLLVASVVIVLLAALELVSARLPLLTHLQPWERFGPLGRLVSRLLLPGWPSAALFFSFASIVIAGVVLLMVNDGSDDKAELIVVTLLLWCGVVFPRALQCLFARGSHERPGLHLILHVMGGVLASVFAAFSFALRDAILAPAALFPSSLFWLTLTNVVKPDRHMTLVAIVAAVWVLALAVVLLWHSRQYRTVVAQLSAHLQESRRG